MTASSYKPRASWREVLEQEEAGVQNRQEEPIIEETRKASQEEWECIQLEVQQEKKRRRLAEEFESGRRGAVIAYDDVADDEDESEKFSESEKSDEEDQPQDKETDASNLLLAGASTATASAVPAAAASGNEVDQTPLPPEEAVTAGTVDQKPKKRGGKKVPGSRKRKNLEGEDGEGKTREHEHKKKNREEDPDRWVKLRLRGDDKPKRIDATRVVSYYDFDTGGMQLADGVGDDDVALGSAPEAPTGDFRAQLCRNMFDDDDEEDE